MLLDLASENEEEENSNQTNRSDESCKGRTIFHATLKFPYFIIEQLNEIVEFPNCSKKSNYLF